MSALNFDWVKENFKNQENFVFFDIGCTALFCSPSVEMKNRLPDGKYYAFEAANHWNDIKGECDNNQFVDDLGINYYHCAVCHIDGEVTLIPSISEYGNVHPWSSSIFKLNDTSSGKIYGEPYSVKSIRLETFCKENKVIPDFIHIDAEGSELKIVQNMGVYKPICIWAETNTFEHYATGTTKEEFNTYMQSIGYHSLYDSYDTLYCQNGFEFTPYIPVIN